MTTQETQRLGQQIGNYRLISWLGKGGFADVYLGEHIYLQTQSAIKILRVQLSDDSLQDFLTEAQTIARLDHPNIIRVLDYGVQGDTPFLVMSYAPNGSLRKRYPRHTRLPLAELLPIIHQMASALDYAHEFKLIHRDIKPENMLIGPQQQVLLSDFGLALAATSSTSQAATNTAGTVPYMAPEQLQGRVRYASDQYALGVVTYEWLCGERPFSGSFTEIASQHVLVPPPSLCDRVPGLPPAVEQVILKALAKDPTQRFENVQSFAQALQQASQFPGMPRSTPFFLQSAPSGTSTKLLQSTHTSTPSSVPSSSNVPNDYMTMPMHDLQLPESPATTQNQTERFFSTPLNASQATMSTIQMNADQTDQGTPSALSHISQMENSTHTKQHAPSHRHLPVLVILVILLIGGSLGALGYRLLLSSTQHQPHSIPSGGFNGNGPFSPRKPDDRSGRTGGIPTPRTTNPSPQTYPAPISGSAGNTPGTPTVGSTSDCLKGSHTNLTFTSLINQTAPPTPRAVALINCGANDNNWVSSIQTHTGTGWLKVSPHAGNLAPGGSQDILVYVSNIATTGIYTGTITITAGSASWVIKVTYSVPGA